MIWVYLVTGLIILTLLFVHAPNYNSKDPIKKRNFNLIWQVGILALMIERIIYRVFIH